MRSQPLICVTDVEASSWMRDPEGYRVVIASPYGTADGAWRPGPDLFT